MVLAEAEAQVEAEAEPRLGMASQSTWQGMARPRTAWHKAQCVARDFGLSMLHKRSAMVRRGGAFGRSGRRVARSFHGTFCNSLIFNTGSKGCTMVRGQVQTEQEATLGFIALGQGESYQVKPGQTTF